MADSYAANIGKLPEKWEKEYTVKGLWYYVTSASDIDDDTMQQMNDGRNRNTMIMWRAAG